jgi:hypothetical protein
MLILTDRIVQLHAQGMHWHDAVVRAHREYAHAQSALAYSQGFSCIRCSESVTTPGYVFDGFIEPSS